MKYLVRNIIWCIIIFILCAIPGDAISRTGIKIPYIDKMVHFAMFFIMGIFMCAELKYQTKLSFVKITIITVLAVALYGGVIEVLQHFYFKSRSGDYYDLLADISGGVAAAFVFPWLKKKKDLLIEKPPFCRFALLRKII